MVRIISVIQVQFASTWQGVIIVHALMVTLVMEEKAIVGTSPMIPSSQQLGSLSVHMSSPT